MTNASNEYKFVTIHRCRTSLTFCFYRDKCYIDSGSVQALLATMKNDSVACDFGMVPDWSRDLEHLRDNDFQLKEAMDAYKVGEVFEAYYKKAVVFREAFAAIVRNDLLSVEHGDAAGKTLVEYTNLRDKVSFAAGRLLVMGLLFKAGSGAYESMSNEHKQRNLLIATLHELQQFVMDCASIEEFKNRTTKRIAKYNEKIEALDGEELKREDELMTYRFACHRGLFAAEKFKTRAEIASYLEDVAVDIGKYGEIVTVDV